MRHDHTDWMIHFVRDRNPDQDFPGDSEEEYDYYAGGELEADASAFAVLKSVIRLGGIIPGYSFRGGRTTIYGGRPAVCATEMPIYSFATYVRERAKTESVSAYGIAFKKTEFFETGGRPVIYGLSTEDVTYKINSPTMRIFDESVLPLSEQYRYVAYNPSGKPNWIDWSHEREWRWKVSDENKDQIWGRDGFGCYGPIPALPIFKGTLDGRPFTSVCIIVWTHEEAAEIQEILTGFYLAGSNNYDTPFDRALIQSSHIIVLQDVISAVENDHSIEAQTIEGLNAANLLQPIKIHPTPAGAKKLVDEAMTVAVEASKQAADAYASKHTIDGGACGYANIITYDVTNPIVQYLLKEKIASGPYDGKVWIHVKADIPVSQSIDYNEHVAEAAQKALSKALGIRLFVEARMD